MNSRIVCIESVRLQTLPELIPTWASNAHAHESSGNQLKMQIRQQYDDVFQCSHGQ